MYGYIVYKRVSGVDAVYFRKMGKSPNSSVYNLYPVTSCSTCIIGLYCKCCMYFNICFLQTKYDQKSESFQNIFICNMQTTYTFCTKCPSVVCLQSVSKHLRREVKSTQYKKLAANALRFTYQNLKSCKPYEKQNKKHQNARFIDEKLKTKSLMFFVSFFSCDVQDFKFSEVTFGNLIRFQSVFCSNILHFDSQFGQSLIG